jgi:hypothetical protein
MRTPILFLSWAFLAATGYAQTEHNIGSLALVSFACPPNFSVVQESGTTAYLIPKKNDKDSPISMRISVFRDARKEGVDEGAVKKFLKEFNKTDKLLKEGENWYSTATDKGIDDAGTKWLYSIILISADGFVVHATVQTIDGREKEAQCKELWSAIPKIIQSIERKKGEQDGTEQPATRPESKPEGSDKPQPEAEGRSR